MQRRVTARSIFRNLQSTFCYLIDSRAYSSVLQAVVMAHLTRPPGAGKTSPAGARWRGCTATPRSLADSDAPFAHSVAPYRVRLPLIRHSCRQCLLYPDPDTLPGFGRARVPLHVSRGCKARQFPARQFPDGAAFSLSAE